MGKKLCSSENCMKTVIREWYVLMKNNVFRHFEIWTNIKVSRFEFVFDVCSIILLCVEEKVYHPDNFLHRYTNNIFSRLILFVVSMKHIRVIFFWKNIRKWWYLIDVFWFWWFFSILQLQWNLDYPQILCRRLLYLEDNCQG